jgi:hypothetical protein
VGLGRLVQLRAAGWMEPNRLREGQAHTFALALCQPTIWMIRAHIKINRWVSENSRAYLVVFVCKKRDLLETSWAGAPISSDCSEHGLIYH